MRRRWRRSNSSGAICICNNGCFVVFVVVVVIVAVVVEVVPRKICCL